MLPPSESLFRIFNIDEQTDMQHIELHSGQSKYNTSKYNKVTL